MRLFEREWLCLPTPAQTNMQEKQPMHFDMSFALKIFAINQTSVVDTRILIEKTFFYNSLFYH